MNYNLDMTSDYSLRELHGFLDISTIPDFVKSGELLTKEAAAAMNEEAFADRYHRAFPIDNAANVYVSNAYFVNKRAALEDKWGSNYVSEVEARIVKAAELFDIKQHIESYNSGLNVKQANDYAENWLVNIDGYELFPYKTASDLAYQAENFAKDIKNYPFAWRSKIASEFVDAANRYAIGELPDLICKYAGFRSEEHTSELQSH